MDTAMTMTIPGVSRNLLADGKVYVMSDHALWRADDRKVTEEEIIDCIENGSIRHSFKAFILFRNNVSVILSREYNTILTVVRHKPHVSLKKPKTRKSKQYTNKKRRVHRKGTLQKLRNSDHELDY